MADNDALKEAAVLAKSGGISDASLVRGTWITDIMFPLVDENAGTSSPVAEELADKEIKRIAAMSSEDIMTKFNADCVAAGLDPATEIGRLRSTLDDVAGRLLGRLNMLN